MGMTSKEAFEQKIGHLHSPGKTKDRKWADWQAACAYQKQKDVRICEKERVDFDKATGFENHACGAESCRDAILHQDDEPGVAAVAVAK